MDISTILESSHALVTKLAALAGITVLVGGSLVGRHIGRRSSLRGGAQRAGLQGGEDQEISGLDVNPHGGLDPSNVEIGYTDQQGIKQWVWMPVTHTLIVNQKSKRVEPSKGLDIQQIVIAIGTLRRRA